MHPAKKWIQIANLGSQGKMGQRCTNLFATEFSDEAQLHSLIKRGDSLDPIWSADVVIDFSIPEVTEEWSQQALNLTLSSPFSSSGPLLPCFLIGTTHLSSSTIARLSQLAEKTPVFLASNFSISVSVMVHFLEQYAPFLETQGYRPVIHETHHLHKKDSPSGTALTLQKAIDPTHPSRIETHSLREGEVVGDHWVRFIGAQDSLEIQHRAQDRSIFARGAIQVALWMVQNRKKGSSLFSEQKILGMADYLKWIRTAGQALKPNQTAGR